MYQSVRQLSGCEVLDPHGQSICLIKRIILDPSNGRVLGFITNHPNSQNILSIMDVVYWSSDHLKLGQNYEFYQSDEIIRIQQALASKCELLGKKVKTESEEQLGQITDYSIDLKKHLLASITVQKNFLRMFYFQTLIIHYNSILEITPEYVIVRDGTVKMPLAQTLRDKSTQRSPAT